MAKISRTFVLRIVCDEEDMEKITPEFIEHSLSNSDDFLVLKDDPFVVVKPW